MFFFTSDKGCLIQYQNKNKMKLQQKQKQKRNINQKQELGFSYQSNQRFAFLNCWKLQVILKKKNLPSLAYQTDLKSPTWITLRSYNSKSLNKWLIQTTNLY